MGALSVSVTDLCVACSRDRSGALVVGVGVPLADVYLEFLGGRSRLNTVLAAAYDLKVFFTVVGKPPDQVRPGDVLAFITAQRTGRPGEHGALQPVDPEGEPAGVSSATVRRRLSVVSGFFAFLQARGEVAANPVPRGLPTPRGLSPSPPGVPPLRGYLRPPPVLTAAAGGSPNAELRRPCLPGLGKAGMAREAGRAQAGHASIESPRIYPHLADDGLAAQYRKAAEVIDVQVSAGQPAGPGAAGGSRR